MTTMSWFKGRKRDGRFSVAEIQLDYGIAEFRARTRSAASDTHAVEMCVPIND
jgi:hypothetical protein